MCFLIIFDPTQQVPLRVPLISTEVEVDIVENDATGKIKQKFSNPGAGTEKGYEAKYNFPLQSNSAVHCFKSFFLDKKESVISSITAVSTENQEAREKYEQAKANGQTAQLMVQNYESSPDIFEMSVGNIPPECFYVLIEIDYFVPLLEEESGSVKRFRFPSIVGNRYGAVNSPSGNVSTAKAVFDIQCAITMNSNLSVIESPSHKISTKLMVEKSPKKAKVSLALDTMLGQDFVLKIGAEENRGGVIFQDPDTIKNKAFLEAFGDATMAKVSFLIPEVGKEESKAMKKNFVFLVDRSGSMAGASMENCIKALQLCLTSLPENCTFNICSFGSEHEFLFPESVEYSEKNLSFARAAISKFQASLGGTEVLAPLQVIFNQAANVKIPTVVFLLTDGEVSNTEIVVQSVKKAHSESAVRLFSCGIGSSVSTHLVEGIAKAAKGTATFIAYGERMNSKLASQMNEAILDPVALGKVDLGLLKLSSSDLSWTPESVLHDFAVRGQLISFYVPVEVNSLVNLSKANCKLFDRSGSELSTADIILSSRCNLIVPALSERVKFFSDKKSDKRKAVALAIAGNLVSKFTSLIGVDESGNKVEVKEIGTIEPPRMKDVSKGVQLRHVPQRFLNGLPVAAFGGSKLNQRNAAVVEESLSEEFEEDFDVEEVTKLGIGAIKVNDQSVADLQQHFSEIMNEESTLFDREFDQFAEKTMRMIPMQGSDKAKKSSAVTKSLNKFEILDLLILVQNGNGSFASSPELLKALGIESFGINEHVPGFVTAVVAVYLEEKLPDLKSEWQLLQEKALIWVTKNAASESEVLKLAKSFVVNLK